MNAREQLVLAVGQLATERDRVRWQLRRLEAAHSAALEALSLVEHDPILQALASTPTDVAAVDMSPASDPADTSSAPVVTCADGPTTPANTPDSPPDSPPAVSVQPKRRPGQRARRSTDPNWVEVADAMRAKPDGVSMRQHLIATFGASATTVKNWPDRVRALGLLADSAPTPAQTVMVRALMCQTCDYHVPMGTGIPGVTMKRHVFAVHGRIDLHPSERTPTDVPVDVPAANGVA